MMRLLSLVRRAAVLTLPAAILTMLFVLGPPPAHACACGGFVTSPESTVQVDREVAAISWDGQNERIVLSLQTLSDATDGALLIPTPAPAEVGLAEEGVFDALEQIIAPEVQVRHYWWPRRTQGSGAPTSGAGVQVLEQVDLGPVEASVLSAADPDELAQWLADHGYVMEDSLAAAISPYVTEGWYYVAVRLTAADTLTGELPPLDLTFESSSVVYPMRMSAAARAPQHVRTYVFADQRMVRSDPTAQSSQVQLRYAGAPDLQQVRNTTLSELLRAGPYLTVMDQAFRDPAGQVASDFVFERSSNGGDHQEVVVEERLLLIAGIPAGPLITVLGVVVLVAATAAGLLLRRHLRTRAVAPGEHRAAPAPACPAANRSTPA